MKKNIITILLLIIFTPIVVNAENCDFCKEKNIKEYYMRNIKIGQEFNTGDIIYRFTPDDQRIADEDAIGNKYYYDIDRMYSIHSNFYDSDTESVIYESYDAYCYGFIVGFGHMTGSFSYPNDIEYNKNKYWKFERYEVEAGGEGLGFYFKSYNRIINLSITNKVNDLEKYKAKKDETLKYSVTISNSGDGYSENNLITTNVPPGLEIDKNRISNNGTYNEEDNIITWNLDELGPESEYTFNYYAKVIDDNITEYVGNSYMTSKQIKEKVNYSNTIVNVEKEINTPITINNPNTKAGGFLIITTLLLMISSITYITIKRKKHILK